MAAVVRVGRERRVKDERTDTIQYYVTSMRGTAAELGRLIRQQWALENGLNWCLDVTLREDTNKIADGHGGANLGLARQVVASLLNQDLARGSMKFKRLSAALDERYLTQVLQGFTLK